MNLILNKLREPSTWAGIAILGTIFGLPPGTVEAVGQIVGGVAGVAAIVLDERK